MVTINDQLLKIAATFNDHLVGCVFRNAEIVLYRFPPDPLKRQ